MAQAEDHIDGSRERIERQSRLASPLGADGHDTATAEWLLAQFKDTLRALQVDRLAQADNKVYCEPIEWDRYCRIVATYTAGGKDLTLELLKAGLSYGFFLAEHPALVDRALAYSIAEEAARKAASVSGPIGSARNQWLSHRGRYRAER